jgi:hypothetical protein
VINQLFLRYIEEDDLMRFLMRVEIHAIFPLFEGALETGKISKPSFRNWVVSQELLKVNENLELSFLF